MADISKKTHFLAACAAIQSGDLACLAALLERDRTLVRQENECSAGQAKTLLHLACEVSFDDCARTPVTSRASSLEIVSLLLSAGANPNAATHVGWTALHCAGSQGNEALIQVLLAAGASLKNTLENSEGGTPLALALFYARTDAARILVCPDKALSLRESAALGYDLSSYVHEHALAQIASAGLDFYRPHRGFPEWQRTFSTQEILDEALTWASRNGHIGSIEFLLARGANVNANPYRGTALLWAVFADQVTAARCLLDHGADPDLRHNFGAEKHGRGAVALHLAAQFESLACLRLLVERGADPTIRDAAYQCTPLEWAEYVRAERSIRELHHLLATHA